MCDRPVDLFLMRPRESEISCLLSSPKHFLNFNEFSRCLTQIDDDPHSVEELIANLLQEIKTLKKPQKPIALQNWILVDDDVWNHSPKDQKPFNYLQWIANKCTDVWTQV